MPLLGLERHLELPLPLLGLWTPQAPCQAPCLAPQASDSRELGLRTPQEQRRLRGSRAPGLQLRTPQAPMQRRMQEPVHVDLGMRTLRAWRPKQDHMHHR